MRMEEVVRKVTKPVEPNVVGTNVLGKFLQKIALRKFQIVNGYTMLDLVTTLQCKIGKETQLWAFIRMNFLVQKIQNLMGTLAVVLLVVAGMSVGLPFYMIIPPRSVFQIFLAYNGLKMKQQDTLR